MTQLRSIRVPEGLSGAGVGIALLDTGVSEVAGLRPGAGVNLSGVGEIDDTSDTFGHGTFEAGLIAGDRGAAPAPTAVDEFAGGVAPGATIHPIKVAAPDGSTDVANVLAGIQWAVAHRDTHNIRVLSLSFGTNSNLPWYRDPLDYAVQRAWLEGIVVVVAAGNRMQDVVEVTTPGRDPYVLTVGASDDRGTPQVTDDRVNQGSLRGETAGDAKPDLLAPGVGLVSYRVPGSFLDVTMAPDRGDGTYDPTYLTGTGTSHATAVAAGAAALVLEAHPDWSPDQVKGALQATARIVGTGCERDQQGHGQLDVAGAVSLPHPPRANTELPLLRRSWPQIGPLSSSRGSLRIEVEDEGAPGPIELNERTSRTAGGWEFDPYRFMAHGWTAEEWQADFGDGRAFRPTHWAGHSWDHEGFSGAHWVGAHWVGAHWVGAHWVGGHWWGGHWWGAHWV